MIFLNNIKDSDVFTTVKFHTPKEYNKRITVKAIVQNKENKIAFVTNDIHKYILLPGGGAESLNLEEEVLRECDEEINFLIKDISELCRIKEFRNRNAKEYETICFIANVDKESNNDTRTEEEKDNNLKVIWYSKEDALKKLKEQIEELKKGNIPFYNTAFNVLRDYMFFKEYVK